MKHKKKEMSEKELDESMESENLVDSETSDTNLNSENADKLQSELTEQKDKHIRLLAEFDNDRRRTSKENIELRQTAGREIISSLLDVLDDMDRAEEQMNTGSEAAFKEGVLLIFNKFRRILESKGLKGIETLHTEFDVEKDEAISEVPVEEDMKGKVVAEVQKGYLLNDKLIRFAKVVVGK